MTLKHLLLGTALLCGPVLPVVVQAADRLAPRAEVSVKGGSQRSMLTTEFWAPLAQKSDRVVYADVRLMGDNDENREGNLGFGYRQIYAPTNSVLGVHGWVDRRRTEHNSTFHQITLGVESLGDKIDLRANGYVPLNGGRTVTLPNLGSTTPYLAGTGLYYDTNGFVNETPQYGLDAEAGYRLPLFEKHVDALRIYGGGYHFFRSGTENVTGLRLRTEAQINRLISVGARFQHDGPRGSQGFLEATLRFPFSAKKLYQKDQLRSRLDESPERDIDIVTASKADTGLRKQIVNNTTGETQRILYVDNTNTNTGDGTRENPFNNLISAQSALQANDILYVFRGDGTTANMDQGITISQHNIKLIGSGSDLTVGGFTFLNAGDAPVITNTNLASSSTDYYNGNGVLVTGDSANISGIHISNTGGNGIIVISDTADRKINSASISNVAVLNAGYRNIFAFATSGGEIGNISISNSNASGSLNTAVGRGIEMRANGSGSRIGNISLQDNTITLNASQGVVVYATQSATIDNAVIENLSTVGNLSNGMSINADNSGTLNNVSVNNMNAHNNLNRGLSILLNSSGTINQISINNLTAFNNQVTGIYTTIQNGTLGNLSFTNSNISNSFEDNIRMDIGNAGTIGRLSFSDIIANNSETLRGIFINTANSGTISNLDITNVEMNYNKSFGLYLYATNATSVINNVNISYSDIIGNRSSGTYIRRGNTSAVLNVDFGGGASSSVGQNRIFGNVGNDLNIDRASITAAYNWWNNGGAAPSRVVLQNGGSATYPSPLATDPRP